MHRIFLGLAVTDGTLLLIGFLLGFPAAALPRGAGSPWYGLHFLLGLTGTMTTLLVHSVVFTYFLGTTRWVKEVVAVYRMPEWVYAQAVRNKRRTFPFELWGMVLVGAVAWLGAAADTRRGFGSAWHLGMAALALGFNLGAFVAEYAGIVAQARLLLEVKERADRLREERLAARAGAAGDLDPTDRHD
jgi:hypothetical protein